MEILGIIKNCNHLSFDEKLKAITDIKHMTNDKIYASKVYFTPRGNTLNNLFAWENSELGQEFWTKVYNKITN